MSENTQIPLQELKLPQTGAVVMMYKYLTIGQSRELQRFMLQGGDYDIEAAKLRTLPVGSFLDMQDKAAEFLIKEIKIGEETQPFSKEWLFNLPLEDGNLVYNKINEITRDSNLSDEDKKK